MARNHYTVEGPRVASTSMPERAPESFNAWQEELQWERDLERILEDFKYQLREKLRTAYYNNTRSQSVMSNDHQRIQQS
jgi:hypothetical protein